MRNLKRLLVHGMKTRDGFVMGEGAGIMVIESLEHALKREVPILAELTGYAATADAFHITQPGEEGPRNCAKLAIADAGLKPTDIDYVNAHGTSTPVGDLQEIKTIKAVFGEHANKIMVSSTKSMHGHMLGAAGAVEAIIGVKSILEKLVPPTINLDNPSEGCDIDLVPHVARQATVRNFLSNSYGFGGTNVCLVFSAYEA